MSLDNPLWGALRIHGELLKLGFQVAQSTVAKYTIRGHGRPPRPELVDISAQSHARDRGDGPVHRADACLQPALWLRHRSPGSPRARLARRDEKPTADWIARQIREAFPWSAPGYLIRDR